MVELAATLTTAAYVTPVALEADTDQARIALWGVLALNLGVSLRESMQAQKKIELRDRLEVILERDGFSERVMATTTQEYCTQQAARIACENTGYLEVYEGLCGQRSDTNKFTWLPHF